MFYGTLVLLLFFLVTPCYAYDEAKLREYRYKTNWLHCGRHEETKIKYFNLMLPCYNGLLDFNHCCALQKDCYEMHHSSKEYCDLGYERCNKYVVGKRCFFGIDTWSKEATEYSKTNEMHYAYEYHEGYAYQGPFYSPQARNIPPRFTRMFDEYHKICPYYHRAVSACAHNMEQCFRGATSENQNILDQCQTTAWYCLPKKHGDRSLAEFPECCNITKRLLYELDYRFETSEIC